MEDFFKKVTISLLSPDDILNYSYGEVLSPETISYKTLLPAQNGLFCERIFGPLRNFKCSCGRCEGISSRGIICEKCGVEVTRKSVRRERFGHINLATPIVNSWFFKTNKTIDILLGMSSHDINRIIYCQSYFIFNPGALEKYGYKKNDVITETDYYNLTYKYKDLFKHSKMLDDNNPEKIIMKTGGEAIYDLLKNFDLDGMFAQLKDESKKCTKSKQDSIKSRLKVIKSFIDSRKIINGKSVENKPEWMVFKVLPVLPADLRQMMIIGGVVATVDLNTLYKNILIRNNVIRSYISDENAPENIINLEKRFLQIAVDSLIDNSKNQSSKSSTNVKSLKSISEMLKGKNGRFRSNLLGKRVDYSGRSAIIVDPYLDIHQCGLPVDMAIELFLPFIIRRLIDRGCAMNAIEAKEIIDKKEPVIYDILDNLLKGYSIILNRAPTLHKMSIQSFQPKLIEEKAIALNPLVCGQFNADFDGDQFGVHIPLTMSARLESNLLLLSSNNLLRAVDGDACFVPNREMVLGYYYLTMNVKKSKAKNIVFSSIKEVFVAYNNNVVKIHNKIKLYVKKNDKHSIIETTVGRVIFNSVFPSDFEFINDVINSSKIKKIVNTICKKYNSNVAVKIIDDLKLLGFEYSHKSGISFNVNDILDPNKKQNIVDKARKNVEIINEGFSLGVVSDKERYTQIVDVWNKATETVKENLIDTFESDDNDFNSVYMMLKSGARGSEEQIRQLSGMRGLMSKSQKDIAYDSTVIETPVIASFKDGLNPYEYFISTYGGRKGMIDTALKTANAGYLTRKLVDVVQSMVVQMEDCGTYMGYPVFKFNSDDNDNNYFLNKITDRISSFDIKDPFTGDIIVKKDEEINGEIADRINKSGISCVFIRSIFTCKCKNGVCSKCYGKDLSRNMLVPVGEAVGIIAAQSIGEPGTQLTLNTFHAGGVAGGYSIENYKVADFDGILHFDNLQFLKKNGINIVTSKFCEVSICDPNLGIVFSKNKVPYGANLYFNENDVVKKGDKLFDWDQYFFNVISTISGIVHFENFEGNVILQEIKNEKNEEIIINKIIRKNVSFISIIDDAGKKLIFNLYEKSHVFVFDGQKVEVGDIIFKFSRNIRQSSDITGGLPRVTELFEARKDINSSILSEIDGIVSFGEKTNKKIEIIVSSLKADFSCVYSVPLSTEILVQNGEFIKLGSPITSGNINVYEILKANGFFAVCEYLISELKSVYESQGVFISDKHFELIINQMFSMVEIIDSGDTDFIQHDIVSKKNFQQVNDDIFDKNVIIDAGGSLKYKKYQIIKNNELILENIYLKNNGEKEIVSQKAKPAVAKIVLSGISNVSLNTDGWISAASFQSTISVLADAAISSTVDNLVGLKENLIVGHKVPCGTNFKNYF